LRLESAKVGPWVYTYLIEYGSLEPPPLGPLARIPQPLSAYLQSRRDNPQGFEVDVPILPGGCLDQLGLM